MNVSKTALAAVLVVSMAARIRAQDLPEAQGSAEQDVQKDPKEKPDAIEDLRRRMEKAEQALLRSKLDDPSTFRAYWRDGLTLETSNKAFVLQVGGRIQLDGGYVDYNGPLQTTLARPKGYDEGWYFRRARLQAMGTLFQQLGYKIELEFSNSSVAFADVFLEIKDIGIASWLSPDLVVGHFKEPYSLEELTSDLFLTFVERSPAHAFTPSRNVGLMLRDTVAENRIGWAIGAFKDVPPGGNSAGLPTSPNPPFPGPAPAGVENGRYAATARVTALPWYEGEGKELVHVGFGYTFREPPMNAAFSVRAENRLTPYFMATPNFPAVDVHNQQGVDFEIATVWGPLSLQGEFMKFHINRRGALPDVSYTGYYAQLAWFLTGESRPYRLVPGAFDRPKPLAPLGSDGGAGAWELAFRYSYLTLRDLAATLPGPVPGPNTIKDCSFALNWYSTPNTVIFLDYIRSLLSGFGNAQMIMIRFQVDF